MKDIYHLASTLADPNSGVISTSAAFFAPPTAAPDVDVAGFLQTLCDGDDARWNTNEAPGSFQVPDDFDLDNLSLTDIMSLMGIDETEGEEILQDNLQDA